MKKGFTLIELLVVIAIIAILAALLFPVFTRAKMSAQQTRCLNNMTQIGKAMLMYSDDYQGSLPCPYNTEGDWGDWTRTWRERMWKGRYLKSKLVLLCSVKNKTPDGRVFSPFSHYGMCAHLFSKNGITAPPIQGEWLKTCFVATIALPSKTILLAENNNGDWDSKPRTEEGSGVGSGGFWAYHGDNTHPGGVFLMCDNHAKFMTVDATELPTNGIQFYYWKRVKSN